METLKLFNITKKEGEKYAPDLPYIISTNEQKARWNYGSFNLKKLIARLNKDIKEKLTDYKKEISENTKHIKHIKRETSHMKKLNLLLSTK